MQLQPLRDRVLVKRIEAEAKTASGIIIPDNAQEKPVEGEIVAVGEGKVLDNGQVAELKVKVGDKVVYGKYAGSELADGYLIMREDDILGVLN